MNDRLCEECIFYKNDSSESTCELNNNTRGNDGKLSNQTCEMYRKPKGVTVGEQLGNEVEEVWGKAKSKGISRERFEEILSKDINAVLWGGS